MRNNRIKLIAVCVFGLVAVDATAAEKVLPKDNVASVASQPLSNPSYEQAIELASQKAKIDGLEKHIDFVNNRFEDISIYLTGLSILLTVLAFAASFGSYFAVRAKTREQAQEAAKEWFDNKTIELERRLDSFRKKLMQLESDTSEQAELHLEAMNKAAKQTQNFAAQATAKMQQNLASVGQQAQQKEGATPEPTETQALQEKAAQLKDKPVEAYKFSDWQTLAFAAYAEDRKEDAARYWQKSLDAPDATDEDMAQALFNAAAILTQLNRIGEASKFLDELNTHFELSPNRTVRRFVLYGGALRAEGYALEKREADAGQSLVEFITKQEVLRDNAHQAQLLWLKNAAGFYLLLAAKKVWSQESQRTAFLQAAYPCLLSASNSSETELKFLALGNQAYCNFLMGGSRDVTDGLLTEGLILGGEKLYRAELQDIDTHPVKGDDDYRQLLESIWASIKQAPKV